MENGIFNQLKEPFRAKELEWRVQRAMTTSKGQMAVVLCYLTSRAVMNRLDSVLGLENWQDEYELSDKGVMCKLSIRTSQGDWITKQDGAEYTNIESFKGGLSDALKRTAVKIGIGRYLYYLEEYWVDIGAREDGSKYINDKKSGIKGHWMPPISKLPAWALPNNEGKQ